MGPLQSVWNKIVRIHRIFKVKLLYAPHGISRMNLCVFAEYAELRKFSNRIVLCVLVEYKDETVHIPLTVHVHEIKLHAKPNKKNKIF